jgi:hypothetical protein
LVPIFEDHKKRLAQAAIAVVPDFYRWIGFLLSTNMVMCAVRCGRNLNQIPTNMIHRGNVRARREEAQDGRVWHNVPPAADSRADEPGARPSEAALDRSTMGRKASFITGHILNVDGGHTAN